MDGTLVIPSPAGAPADLLNLVQQLLREVLTLRHEVDSLRRENVELKQQANYLEGHEQAVHHDLFLVQKLKQQANYLEGHARSGRSSSRATRR